MKIWTYEEVRDKIQRDLDLQEETFVLPEELIDYVNEGIDEAESEIHKLNEDYFLARTTLSLVNGTASYDLPADIYGTKIRGLIYQNGTRVYPIRRVKSSWKFLSAALSNITPTSTTELRYLITNTMGVSPEHQITMFPTPMESGTYVTVWYLRNALRIPQVGDLKTAPATYYTQGDIDAWPIDIPEFITFVIQYAKTRCLEKDNDPRYAPAVQLLQGLRKNMVDTLTQAVPDDDDEIPVDLSHYQEGT